MTHRPPAVRESLHHNAVPRLLPDSALADLVFLESWERDPAPGPAAMRRVMQIRRANPELAAAIRERCARH